MNAQSFTILEGLLLALLTTLVAVVINATITFLGEYFGVLGDGIAISRDTGHNVGLLAITVTTAITTFTAILVYWIFHRFTSNPEKGFIITSIIVFLLMVGGPYKLQNATFIGMTLIELTHVIVLVIVYISLIKFSPFDLSHLNWNYFDLI